MYDQFDANHDGNLCKNEFVDAPFAAMNQNGIYLYTLICLA